MKDNTQPNNKRMAPSITYDSETHLFVLSLSGPDSLDDAWAANIAKQIKDAPTNQMPVSLTPEERLANLSHFYPESAAKIKAHLDKL